MVKNLNNFLPAYRFFYVAVYCTKLCLLSAKILACMLKASADVYDIYKEKGIGDGIYFALMKCYTRFIDETFRVTGKLYFDRWWWTTRQAGCHLFRIGELEYEMKHIDDSIVIGIHIPSDLK